MTSLKPKRSPIESTLTTFVALFFVHAIALPPDPDRGAAGRTFESLHQALHALSADCCAFAYRVRDETTAPVLDPIAWQVNARIRREGGRGKTKTGYLWALARDDRGWGGEDPPGVVYFYADGRGGKHAEDFLKGFNGILQVDAYAGYNRLTTNTRADGALTLAYC